MHLRGAAAGVGDGGVRRAWGSPGAEGRRGERGSVGEPSGAAGEGQRRLAELDPAVDAGPLGGLLPQAAGGSRALGAVLRRADLPVGLPVERVGPGAQAGRRRRGAPDRRVVPGGLRGALLPRGAAARGVAAVRADFGADGAAGAGYGAAAGGDAGRPLLRAGRPRRARAAAVHRHERDPERRKAVQIRRRGFLPDRRSAHAADVPRSAGGLGRDERDR